MGSNPIKLTKHLAPGSAFSLAGAISIAIFSASISTTVMAASESEQTIRCCGSAIN